MAFNQKQGGPSAPVHLREPIDLSLPTIAALVNSSLLLNVAQNDVAKLTGVDQSGKNPDTDLPFEIIWNVGSASFPVPSIGVQLDIQSSSSQDNPLGIGAASVTVQGLNSNLDEIQETTLLDGLTTIQTISLFRRVNKAFVATRGSASTPPASNIGDITFLHGADTMAQITASKGQTQMATFSVARFRTLFLIDIFASVMRTGGAGAKTDIELHIITQQGVERTIHEWSVSDTGTTFTQPRLHFIKQPPLTGPLDIIEVAFPSVNNTSVSGGFTGVLKND